MTESKTLLPIDFSKVQLLEAAFINLSIKTSPTTTALDDRKVASFSSRVSHKKSFSLEDNGIKIEMEVECSALNKSGQALGFEGYFQIGFSFVLENLADYSIHIPGIEEKLPAPELVIPIVGMAYSTARGMIMIKTSGTHLEGFSLPIVNAQSLMQQPKPEKKKKKAKKA